MSTLRATPTAAPASLSASSPDAATRTPRADPAVRRWMTVVCIFVVAMVVIGGVTRLTRSGLSIVEWKPVVGALPPLSDADWRDALRAYQDTPQYRLQNAGMSLEAFKRIFFWEYVHRLVGRVIGIVFVVPLVYFAWKRRVTAALARRLAMVFALGGMQGALGWFMVKSGLVDMPTVSHYRLAAHLSLALVVLSVLFWTRLDLGDGPREVTSPRLRAALFCVLALTCVQIVWGAFTAGLHAGIGYNTFPKMQGAWVPPDAFASASLWRNAVETPAMVQLVHRVLGTLLLLSAIALAVAARRAPPGVRSALLNVGTMALTQYALGVATLLLIVPVSLGAAHQLGACMLLLMLLRALHRSTT